ncbi:MAG: ferredoxin [Thermodesulfobacteria bacterium]|nr:ferredoxin [Thermodesulfobacteriota bacterium]
MTKKEIYVDRLHCKGCGACEEVAPEAFRLDDSEKVDYLGDDKTSPEKIEMAANLCPTKCIEIIEE